MSDETWDGHRAVSANSGETQFRVRGNRMVDTNTGVTSVASATTAEWWTPTPATHDSVCVMTAV